MNLDIEIIAEGLAFPEGPIALSDGSVLFVEIIGGTLKRAWGDGRVEVVATPGGGPNGAQLGPDGAVYVCNNGGLDMVNYCHADGPGAEGRIERINLATGKVERVYDRCGEHALSAPNDMVFDAQGGMWFTDLGKNRPRSIAPAALYYCRPDGSQIVEAHYGTLSYNGVGLSPDERTLYVSDTKSARLWRYDLAGPGLFARERAAASRSLVGAAPGDVSFDSLAVTESGQICVATLGEGAISVFAPSGGSATIGALPDHTVTNIAFGGADMRTAFITLAGSGRLVRCRWPEPGLKLNFAL